MRIIDKGSIRVGNEKYTKIRDSRGATTLTQKNVQTDETNIMFEYKGKSGKQTKISFADKKIQKLIDCCLELNGKYLFSYKNKDDSVSNVTSKEVNEYLYNICKSKFTAKDFRTWWGSVVAINAAAKALDENPSLTAAKLKNIAITKAAKELSNTKAICKKSYIHPGILSSIESKEFSNLIEKIEEQYCDIAELSSSEITLKNALALLNFL